MPLPEIPEIFADDAIDIMGAELEGREVVDELVGPVAEGSCGVGVGAVIAIFGLLALTDTFARHEAAITTQKTAKSLQAFDAVRLCVCVCAYLPSLRYRSVANPENLK